MEVPTYGNEIRFRYRNWQKKVHDYVVRPEKVEYAEYDETGSTSNRGGERNWVMHGACLERDGKARADEPRRTFLLLNMEPIPEGENVMKRPIVVNMRNTQNYDEKIDRTTGFGNPFIIGRDGDREEVIAKYKEYAENDPWIQKNLHKLAGKRIACWCAPDPCHGDVLADMVEELDG